MLLLLLLLPLVVRVDDDDTANSPASARSNSGVGGPRCGVSSARDDRVAIASVESSTNERDVVPTVRGVVTSDADVDDDVATPFDGVIETPLEGVVDVVAVENGMAALRGLVGVKRCTSLRSSATRGLLGVVARDIIGIA